MIRSMRTLPDPSDKEIRMCPKHAFPVLWIGAALVLAACSSDSSPGDPSVSDGGAAVVLDPDAPAALLDPVSIDTAWVDPDSLHLVLTHFGGCEEHGFGAVADPEYRDGPIPAFDVYVRHDNADDPCDAIERTRLAFGMGDLRARAAGALGEGEPFLLTLVAPRGDGTRQRVEVVVADRLRRHALPDEDVETLAVLLGETLQASPVLAAAMASELDALAPLLEQHIPVAIAYRRPFLMQEFVLRFRSDYGDLVGSGEYRAWDRLNTVYGVEWTDWDSNSRAARLTYTAPYSPLRMLERYLRLPGAAAARVTYLLGDGSTFYPGIQTTGRSYLFRRAQVCLPGGCEENRFWYYRFENGSPHFVGTYDPRAPTAPSWWAEASRNLQRHERWEADGWQTAPGPGP